MQGVEERVRLGGVVVPGYAEGDFQRLAAAAGFDGRAAGWEFLEQPGGVEPVADFGAVVGGVGGDRGGEVAALGCVGAFEKGLEILEDGGFVGDGRCASTART